MGDFVKNDHALESVELLLAVDQLAKLIHKSPASIRSDASRNLKSLPPICRLPGSKRLLWRPEDVRIWIASFVESGAGILPPVVPPSAPRGRGRPRKVARP